jgi:hypothetical protein
MTKEIIAVRCRYLSKRHVFRWEFEQRQQAIDACTSKRCQKRDFGYLIFMNRRGKAHRFFLPLNER